MPSSRTEKIEALTSLYDSAFEAATQGELNRVGALLNRADELLLDAEPGAHDEALAQLESSHARLRSTLQSAMDEARREITEARKAAKAITAYAGGARRPTGARHRSSL